jgi:16S rRNA A1518/A1519 N6-dimethyltransferase RsmA/KsgA/DIM1 with predicted DNA glycosylase/AP lyase activity
MFTSDLMNVLTNVSSGPELGYVILQKESASMYGGSDLDSSNSLKSLLALPFYTFKIVHNFSKSDFTPRPTVDSVLLQFAKKSKPLLSINSFDLWSDFLAFVSQDRIGEGNWKKLFSKPQLSELANKGLVLGKGIKTQKMNGIIYAFNIVTDNNLEQTFTGAMEKLQKQQSKLFKQNRTRKSKNWKRTS